ncbi:MAG: Na+/H+ antiporter NhaA [Clostridium sp.]|nr:Na+/H+ antiporter NhaA [Clostridium sp.]
MHDTEHNTPSAREPEHSIFYAARQTLRHYASGGNVLMAATLLALIVANIPGLNTLYDDFWQQEIRLQVGSFNLFSHDGHPMSMLAFINDALMAIFFFSIGLEIKREILVGELASFRQALLPIMGAFGGMVLPVAIFFMMSSGTDYSDGAAIPMATDIAFSLGVLAILGSRVPVSLKVFLTTLAVVDDIGGIIVIALFYSGHINALYLLVAAGLFGVLLLGSRMKIKSKMFYVGIGGVIWFLFLNSGIHPTIAGVLVALCVPATPVYPPKKYIKKIRRAISNFRSDDDESLSALTILDKNKLDWLKQIESASDKVISPLQDMEDTLHPVVNYLIVPLFAFANAGICLAGLDPASIVEGISLAIILGLVVGKFVGILGFSWLTVRLGWAPMPERCDWRMMASVSLLGGIGFTVSLFIANLTFVSGGAAAAALLGQAKLGIIVGSLLAGVGGFVLLNRFLPREPQVEPED